MTLLQENIKFNKTNKITDSKYFSRLTNVNKKHANSKQIRFKLNKNSFKATTRT